MAVSTENTKTVAAEAAAPSTPEKKVPAVVPEAQSTGATEKKVVTSPVAEKPTESTAGAATLNPSKRYRRVQRNREEKDDKALAHEVRITVSGGVGLFVKEGVRKLLDTTEGVPEIKVMARGPAIAKAVIVSEMINRMIPDLEQDVELGSTDVNDEYVSVDETHETVVATRIVPFLVITITHPNGLIDKSTVSRRPRNTRVPIATKADIAAIKEKKSADEQKAAATTEQPDEAAASKKKARKNNRRNRSNRNSAKATDVTPTTSEKTEVTTKAEEPKKAETAAPAKKAETAAPAKKAETAAPAKKAETAAPAKKAETAAPAKKAAPEVEKEPSAFDGAVKPRSK